MSDFKVVISVSGGNVNGIFTDNPDAEVYLVDYDNLESEQNGDCSHPFTSNSLDDLRAVVATEVNSLPGIAKLLLQLKK